MPHRSKELTEHWRPVGYVTVEDSRCRAQIVAALQRQGWAVVEPPTGFHLVQALADLIDGDRPWLRPGLIVVDAAARGCAGTTIARGLRELGLAIPVILVTSDRAPLHDHESCIVDPAHAAARVAEVARPRSPTRFLDPTPSPARAVA